VAKNRATSLRANALSVQRPFLSGISHHHFAIKHYIHPRNPPGTEKIGFFFPRGRKTLVLQRFMLYTFIRALWRRGFPRFWGSGQSGSDMIPTLLGKVEK
jgi:hypothetical protein